MKLRLRLKEKHPQNCFRIQETIIDGYVFKDYELNEVQQKELLSPGCMHWIEIEDKKMLDDLLVKFNKLSDKEKKEKLKADQKAKAEKEAAEAAKAKAEADKKSEEARLAQEQADKEAEEAKQAQELADKQ